MKTTKTLLLLIVMLSAIAIAASCGGGEEDGDGDGGGTTPIPSGTLLFTATSNPSSNYDYANSIAIDSAYMYVVGVDRSPGNGQWRIEKRNLSDGALVSGFGTGGVVTSNPSTGEDLAFSIAIDSTYMYVAGWDSSPAIGKQWRIEKRNLSDGQLVSGFGTGGVVTNDPSTGDDKAVEIAIDSAYMYVVGVDSSHGNYQWRIEKRNLSDGALVAGFGAGGVVATDPSAGHDMALEIAIDSDYMYIVGCSDGCDTSGSAWRIEKRNLSDGALAAGFGSNGVVTGNPISWAYSIAIDSTYMYVLGDDDGPGNIQWRIEKRNLSDGALAADFGTGGVVTTNPSSSYDEALSIAIDSAYMYVIGYDSSPGNYQWRIEKRNLSDGALAAGFGTGGVVVSNPSAGTDYPTEIAIDSTYMYIAGVDSSPGNIQWRIEKRVK